MLSVQSVFPDPASQSAVPGGTVEFSVTYATDPAQPNLTGLGLRMHFDSTKLTFGQLSNVLSNSLFLQAPPANDTANFDGDAATDKYVNIAWADFTPPPTWPGESSVSLFTAAFVASSGATGSTQINFTAISVASGWSFDGTSASIQFAGGNANPTTPIDSNGAADSVAEGSPIGTLVGITASSSDPDGSTITYSLTDNADGRFAINSSTGVVSVADGSLLNYETATGHTITVQASDGAGGTASQNFTINVTNVDPTAPTDTNPAADSVAEGTANGTLVGITVSSSDPNGPAVTYSLTDNAGGRFAINSSTGVVSVADGTLLNRVTAASHTITVQASDSAGGTASQSFTISIINNNDSPTGTVTIDDATPIEDQQLTASNTLADADGLGTITYTWQKADDAAFTTGVITIGTGSIFTPSEAEVGKHLRVTANYTDGQGTPESVSSAVTDAVANVNDAPTGTVTVDDTTPTVNQQLTASNTLADEDGLGTISYTWQRADDATFTTNVVTVATGPTFTPGDAEVGKYLRTTASYTDGHGTAESVNSMVIGPVANLNNVQSVLPDAASQSVMPGNSVEFNLIYATDPAQPNLTGLGLRMHFDSTKLAFEQLSNVLSNSLFLQAPPADDTADFDGDAATDKYVNIAWADFVPPPTWPGEPSVSLFTAAFVASSGATGSTQVNFTASSVASGWSFDGTPASIQFADANLNPTTPIDSNTAADSVAEGAPNGTLVGITANSSDPDGSTITYSLTDAAGGRFAINSSTGVVIVADGSLLNYETAASHTITVQASDGAGGIASQSFTISVINNNDSPTGTVTIDDATPIVNQQLTASNTLADEDGLGTLSYTWQRADDATFTTNVVTVATGPTFTPGDAEVGKYLRATASYTDGHGTAESVNSVVTDAVAQSGNELDLGVVAHRVLLNLNLDGGPLRFRLATSQAGFLTLLTPEENVTLTLYDSTMTQLAANNGRIDQHAPTAGEVYYAEMAGNGQADLTVMNLVQHAGKAVDVRGTDGGDTFAFNVLSAARSFAVNGVVYELAASEATTFTFDGLGGSDHVSFLGAPSPEIATIYPDNGTFTGEGYSLSVTHIESTDYDGGGDNGDTVCVWGAKDVKTNVYTGRPGQAEMAVERHEDPGALQTIITVKAAQIYGRGGGGRVANHAKIYDSPGNDLFELFPVFTRVTFSEPGYFQQLLGFTNIVGQAERGNGDTDTAILRGSPKGDWFQSTTTGTRMLTLGAWRNALGFDTIVAYGRGAVDTPNKLVLQDTPAADTLTLKPSQAVLSAPAYFASYQVSAYGFGTIEATRVNVSGDQDVVNLSDSSGDDVWEANPDWAQISSAEPAYSNRIIGFPIIKAYSAGVGSDKAFFSDFNGEGDQRILNDTFTTTGTVAELTSPAYQWWARYFDEVHATVKEGYNAAHLSGGQVAATATGMVVTGSNARGAFAHYADSFDEVNGVVNSVAESVRMVLTEAAIDRVISGAPHDAFVDSAAQLLWLDQFEKMSDRESTTSRNGDIDQIDAAFAWWP